MNHRVIPSFEGELYTNQATRRIYATDASAYREVPEMVAIPKNEEDIKRLIDYVSQKNSSLIFRAGGTSLAGQVVGKGVIVDISKYFKKILEVNVEEKWAWVQPGIIRDDLNNELKKHGLFFAPETSTSNRAMMGGMIGNNSCGANSIIYGSTREHVLALDTILSDKSEHRFEATHQLASQSPLVQSCYDMITTVLSKGEVIKKIKKEFPDDKIPRRNTGYALDLLAKMRPFNPKGRPFNFCELLVGSEGTLAFVKAAKIKLSTIPPPHKRLLCLHCNSIDEALRANLTALEALPTACELMDDYIFEATRRNIGQQENSFFIEGNPKAILVVELTKSTEEEVEKSAKQLAESFKEKSQGYACPIVVGEDINKVWALRKAGLGLLNNIPGDEKPVPVIEDTAVDVNQLPQYIAEFNQILEKYGLHSVHYAHVGSGELHLRPIINLKTSEGIKLFRCIAEEIAELVKKYKGSLSGEHGDGRLRGEFLPKMVGDEIYQLFKDIKNTWDPSLIFNPQKIVDTPPMDTSLRYKSEQITPEYDTAFDFSKDKGIVRATELCNGSGDCRKSPISGGTMCPSYMASLDEKDTTRARANILREFFTYPNKKNPFLHEEINEVMDLCLSCKGCKKECPSNVDMAKLKAEWLHQKHLAKGISWRTWAIGNYDYLMSKFSNVPWVYNMTRNLSKPILGFAKKRSIPKMSAQTLTKWFLTDFSPQSVNKEKQIAFFFDEFTNYLDVEIGKKALLLLDRLGYKIVFLKHKSSGRAYLSKGMLKQAKELAESNVKIFDAQLDNTTQIIGLEPSAILTFRDEYPDLLRGELKETALKLAQRTLTIEEFLAQELDKKNISSEDFTQTHQTIWVHGHCHQKALSSLTPTRKILSVLKKRNLRFIPSGCCGMAGSFGYEKEHYDLSMKIGELVLFPSLRTMNDGDVIVASGTSCRHQILDGVGKKAKHLVEIL